VIVVQQPFACRTDIGAILRGRGEPRLRLYQDATGSVEPGEQGGSSPGGLPAGDALSGGHGVRALGEVLSAEELAPDRTGKEVFPRVSAIGQQAGEEPARRDRSDGVDLGRQM